MNRYTRLERRDDGVAIVWLDQPGLPVNLLSLDVVGEFEELFPALEQDGAVRAVVLASAKRDSFIAGADLKALAAARSAAEVAELSRRGNALLLRLAEQRKPVVAAIHGAALGGGLEVALACHYLLASDDPATVLALPETQLGLLPAGGGTQRLLQRVALARALPILLAGKRLRAREARRIGLVDALTTPGGIAATAATAALLLAQGRLPRRRRHGLRERLLRRPPLLTLVLERARKQVLAKTRGHYPAPLAALECAATGLRRGLRAGLDCETSRFGELVMTPACRSLLRLFLDQQQMKVKWPGPGPMPVRRIGVLGAGFMGRGIASVSVALGPVVAHDAAEEALAACVREVDQGLAKQLRSGALRPAAADLRRSRLWVTRDLAELRGCELVIEAVYEDLELKRGILAAAEEVLDEGAVFASNTSALPIAAIAARARHPERVLGMHYFSPVAKMPLLEIVTAERTAAWAVETARAVGQAQGKTVIVVKDGPGFYTTRILAPFLNEAVKLVEEGARCADVDRALQDFGFPVGPLTLLDEVGIEIGAHVSRDLAAHAAAGAGQVSRAFELLVRSGHLGRKSGRGFYRYQQRRGAKARKQPNQEIYSLLGAGVPRRDFDRSEMQDRLVLLLVNEALRCLEEGVLGSARDGDVGAVLGLGFPPFHGGPFSYADRAGAARLVERLQQLAERHGSRFAPCALLAEQARSKGRLRPAEAE